MCQNGCTSQATGCNLKGQVYSSYVSECRDDCVNSFKHLSGDEEPAVRVCAECLCDTVSAPECGELAITAEGACDCDEQNLEEFNSAIGVPDPGSAELDC